MNYFQTICLLILSNTFMTFAWYSHLKNFHNKGLWIAIITSWGIAFFEYLFLVPAVRIGINSGSVSLAQMKITQEVISLSVFVPFAILYMRQPVTWNFLWAGLCILGAVYFIFR